MKSMRAFTLVLVLVLALTAAGCRDRGDDEVAPTASAPPAGATSTAPASGATAAPVIPSPSPVPFDVDPGNHDRTIPYAGDDRHYVLHVPPRLDASQPTSLVLVLHGGGGNAANAERMSGFSPVADREGFFVVYPDGSGRLEDTLLTWNAGNCCGFALTSEVDDVGFVRDLIESLLAELPVDPKRVYVTGMSNGGMMSYRLACEASDLIAAAAPVAGALNIRDCEPTDPISLVAFHGTADQNVRYEGGEPFEQVDSIARVDTSVAQSVGTFVEHNGCDAAPASSTSGAITSEIYSGCEAGTAVALYTIEGGGHAWPGGRPGSAGADQPTTELDATEVMWAFFESHPKP